jgi:hypothetical protein
VAYSQQPIAAAAAAAATVTLTSLLLLSLPGLQRRHYCLLLLSGKRYDKQSGV